MASTDLRKWLSQRVGPFVLTACGFGASGAPACEGTALSFEDSVAQYGPSLFAAITKVARCGDYRVFVTYANGTDMLFLDKLIPANGESTFAPVEGMSFVEFNAYEASNEIKHVSCKLLDSEGLHINGEAHSFHSNESYEFSIAVDPAGLTYAYQDTEAK